MIAEIINLSCIPNNQNDIITRQVYIFEATQYLPWMCEKMEQIADIEAEAGARIDAIAATGTSFMILEG